MKTSTHNTDNILLEVMLELAEDENEDLRAEIDSLYGYIQYLHDKNKDLVKEYNDLVDINKRYN
jgi:hypothetical protein